MEHSSGSNAADGSADTNSFTRSSQNRSQHPRSHGSSAAAVGIAAAASASRDSSPAARLHSSSRVSLQHGKGIKGAPSTLRSGLTSATSREEVRKRMHDVRAELEGAIHVLDGGINRTPLPLQSRQSLVGGVPHELQLLSSGGTTGSRTDATSDIGITMNIANGELGSSFMRSSFMFNMGRRMSSKRDSTVASIHAQSKGAQEAGDHSSGGLQRSVCGDTHSLESSLQSLSFAGERRMSERSMSVYESSPMRQNRASAAGNTAGATLPKLMQQNALLQEAAYTRPPSLTASEKMAWRKATTTIVLSETPTIFLYSHQDEAVSNEHADEVIAVVARNGDCAAAEETYRTDEGTQFHSTGTITMRAPMKSVQAEVHPPAKKDSGPLQVTPWMLKDAYAAALEAAESADEDVLEERQQREDDAAGEEGGGDDSAVLEGAGSMDDDCESSENGQSTLGSSETATRTMSSDGGMLNVSGAAGATASVDASKQWMLAETLLSTLRIMERAVVQNNMEAAQLAYRGITVDAFDRGAGNAVDRKAVKPTSSARATTETSALPPTAVPQSLPAALNLNMTPLPAVPVEGTGEVARGGEEARVAADGRAAALGSGSGDSPLDARAARTSEAAASSNLGSPTSALPLRLSGGVRLLWRFGSPLLTRGRGVACMTWNQRETDILAVGYTACRSSLLQGDAGIRNDDGAPSVQCKRAQDQEAHGMVCCWSLKNPLAPELILYLRSNADVTALAFSFEHPSLLAVGSSTGEIVVYDIQHDVVFPSIAPAFAGATSGQHTGSICELQWVPKGKEQGEFLTSISADGRVVQWAVGKSIERVPPDLMHLQRQPGMQVEKAFVAGVAEAEAEAAAALAESGAGGKGGTKMSSRQVFQRAAGRAKSGRNGGGGSGAEEAILSRKCGGMCFDICPADTAVYIVGTEDGSVLQCSKSQTENYDFEYEPHSELVYRVRWSPYSAAYFLTCSADWTSRLYKVGTRKAQLRFHSVRQDAVQDVAWSHTNSLIFATATAQGNAEVWTVMDAMYPRATIEYRDHRRLSAVLFAEQETPVLVVGDEEGDVTAFRLDGSSYTRCDLTDDEQESWLEEAVRKQLT
ncbi:hypothetical protein LSCM1_02771 [Leishmania martiniquensis]|uniref:Dynein axonemal intermediate chain 4 n=1 Tax=Leishmania martiniquensis TaxID=1580590 RepID=A0A836GTA6_9TRYP|nr:hypothetical protein LSCM1_02771 [Leishmania martiniquensis]